MYTIPTFLDSLGITSSDPELDDTDRFYFQHTHDLSGLSRICLEVNAPSGFGRQNIDIDDVHIDDSLSPSSQVYVAELKAFANHFLSRVRVSDFAHNLHQPTYSKSRI